MATVSVARGSAACHTPLEIAMSTLASLVVLLLTVKIDENMHDRIVEQLEGRLASEEADKQ